MNKKVWLLAISFVCFLGFGVKQASATNTYPSTITLKHVTDTYEAPDDKDPSSVKLTPQEVYIYGMQPNDGHSAFSWYRITTWRGDKWIKLTEADFAGQEELVASDVALLDKTQLYDAPQSGSATGKWLGKQTVHAEAISGSYLKIGTWLGPKWIRISADMVLDVRTQPQDLKLEAAATPAFARPDGTGKPVMELAPQTVQSFEQKDRWYHIRTSGGSAWVNPDIAIPADVTEQAMTADVQQKTMLFAYPSFDSKPLGVIAPQKVKVVATVGGWKRIESDWVGGAWLYSMPAPDSYKTPPAQEQNAGDRKWIFRQTEVAGSMGKEFPLDVELLTTDDLRSGTLQAGAKLQIGAYLLNLSTNTVKLDEPAQFAIDIVRMNGKEEQTVWSVLLPETAASITGQGNYWIDGFTWNQTDANGNQVPQGDYVVRLRSVRQTTLQEDGAKDKQTLLFRDYLISIPFHILYPVADRTPRLETAKALYQNYLVSQERSSVPKSRRITDSRIYELLLTQESYDDFTFTVSYDVMPASASYKAGNGGERMWDGWIRYDKQKVHVVRQGDGYRIG